MIERNEVEAAARPAFPGQSILGMHQLRQRRLFELKNALVESLS